jgi:hypothetical protein
MPTDDNSNGNSNNNNGGGSNGGGSNSGGSGSGGSGGSGSTGNGASGAGSATPDLTQSLGGLRDSGPKDIKLSDDTKQKYVKLTQTFRFALQDELNKVVGMPTLGNPGQFGSATNTKLLLQNDATGTNGVQSTMQNLVIYLEMFEAAVNSAAGNLLDNG